MTETEIIQYIRNNKNFLKEFHNIYYNLQKEYLNGYNLKDYIIVNYVSFNKIKDFNDYNSFKYKYMLQITPNIPEATELYEDYYNCFLENMEPYLTAIKQKYNKTEEDIKKSYEIKTIWQFYSGFYDEKILREKIKLNSNTYSILNRTTENKLSLDNNYAVDIEIIDTNNNIMAIQCKQLSYLNLPMDKKEIHLRKHSNYRGRFNNNTYYILFKDNAPCYLTINNSYLINSNLIKDLTWKDFKIGTYSNFINWLDKRKECTKHD